MIEEEIARRQRLAKIIEAGIDPYPPNTQRTHQNADVILNFDDLEKTKQKVTVVGRLMSKRLHGGIIFSDIEDGSGKIQIAIKKDDIGEKKFNDWQDLFDLADFVEVTGSVFLTRSEQKTVACEDYKLLAKSLLPLPEKWHGLTDVELRYRKRYLDLIVNENVKNIFKTRFKIIRSMQKYLDEAGYIEVETPILQSVPTGAAARPFKTHHNALDTDMYLRIATELPLKMAAIGGFEKVYEIGRIFRNEGIDHAHNPEFTSLEGYCSYMNYEQLMEFLERMIFEIIKGIGLNPAAVSFNGKVFDFTPSYERITFSDALARFGNINLEDLYDSKKLAEIIKKHNIDVDEKIGMGTIMDQLYKKLVRPKLEQPVFIIDQPAELTPLAKRKRENPKLVYMFQILVDGIELCKAFGELNDPIDQEERFKEQEAASRAGDEEAQQGDPEFVEAMKHGMPPMAGFGIGIDRLTSVLTDSHALKDVILFPTLKPQEDQKEEIEK